ncbi:MAG: NUDIX domain-containing protein|nr:NUDIX domain-containing protein [Candidatus Lokiarchaeota archaeon]MBD3202067.1 NUDIX domain-containing protein [Candidatus Lokiarchaeota archaeon]
MEKYIFDKTKISKHLLSYDSELRICFQDPHFIKGAIVFLIVAYEDKPYDLVLIRRTNRKGDKHAGEMSFPGGKFDKNHDVSFLDTALRETEEELGIPRDQINNIGCFDDHITPKYFIISPFVGYVKPSVKMVKEVKEVKEIVKIPISFFASKKNYKERTYTLNGSAIAVGKYVYRDSKGKKYIVFGATSHLIVHFIERVYGINLMAKGHRRLECRDFQTRIKKHKNN